MDLPSNSKVKRFTHNHEENKGSITGTNDDFSVNLIDKEECVCHMWEVLIPLTKQHMNKSGCCLV